MVLKNLKKMTYEGLGFPVILTNVPLKVVREEEIPDINYNTLQRVVLDHLCHKKSPLTGDEARFIRKYLEMTSPQFAKLFGLSSKEVSKWEEEGEKLAKIAPGAEVCIRLFVFDALKTTPAAFRKLFQSIDIPFLAECQNKDDFKTDPITLDAQQDLQTV